jgi:hypothetical protein
MGEVEVEMGGSSLLDPLHVDGSRIWINFENKPAQGWDFGISGSSPTPVPRISSEGSRLHFIHGLIHGMVHLGLRIYSQEQMSFSYLGDMQSLPMHNGMDSIWLLVMTLERY